MCKSLSPEKINRIFNPYYMMIVYISGFVSIIILNLVPIFKQRNLVLIIYAFTVNILLFIFVVYSMAREYTIAKKVKYANINENRRILTGKLLRLYNQLENIDHGKYTDKHFLAETFHEELIEALSLFKNIFEMLTGTRCRASLKTVFYSDDKSPTVYVKTVARDQGSWNANKSIDKSREQHKMDPIDKNSDFLILFEKKRPPSDFFFSNNLLKLKNYKNSSFEIYGEPKRECFINIFCRTKWPLPYRSTIVWAIEDREKKNVLGFLTIDSESRGVFDKRWDVPIGFEVAEFLSYILDTYDSIMKKLEDF